MNEGWIKIHRKLLDWEWWDEPNTFRLFIYLLLKANHKPKRYRGVLIDTGQLMTGLELLSIETKLSVRQVRTSLTRLKSTNEINVNSSSKGTIIQIVKYIDYQITDKPTTNQRQTNDKPTTTNKNDNNIKKRKEEFKNSLHPFISISYDKILLTEFFEYWTEHGEKDKKMRFEKEKSFSIERRLKTWKIKSVEFKNKGKL